MNLYSDHRRPGTETNQGLAMGNNRHKKGDRHASEGEPVPVPPNPPSPFPLPPGARG